MAIHSCMHIHVHPLVHTCSRSACSHRSHTFMCVCSVWAQMAQLHAVLRFTRVSTPRSRHPTCGSQRKPGTFPEYPRRGPASHLSLSPFWPKQPGTQVVEAWAPTLTFGAQNLEARSWPSWGGGEAAVLSASCLGPPCTSDPQTEVTVWGPISPTVRLCARKPGLGPSRPVSSEKGRAVPAAVCKG